MNVRLRDFIVRFVTCVTSLYTCRTIRNRVSFAMVRSEWFHSKINNHSLNTPLWCVNECKRIRCKLFSVKCRNPRCQIPRESVIFIPLASSTDQSIWQLAYARKGSFTVQHSLDPSLSARVFIRYRHRRNEKCTKNDFTKYIVRELFITLYKEYQVGAWAFH